MRPGAGAGTEIIFVINIFCIQFSGRWDEEKLISTSISMLLLLKNSFKWQYMAVAGARVGARAKLWTKVEPELQINNWGNPIGPMFHCI